MTIASVVYCKIKMSNIIESIAKFFGKVEIDMVENERTQRAGFVEFANILANQPSLPYKKLHLMVVKYMNNPVHGGYHYEYLSSVTISLLVYLKTIKNEENREEKILRYLNTYYDVSHIDDNETYSLYDVPDIIEKIYDY